MGAVRTTQRGKFTSPRYAAYATFKKLVALKAAEACCPRALGDDDNMSVSVAVNWKRRQRIDLDNLVKAVLDSLWRQDRRVTRISCYSRESAGYEDMRVTVEVLRSKW